MDRFAAGAGREPDPLTLEARDLAFATDLYQLTMAGAYHALAGAGRLPERAVFELWVRRFPPHRNFLVFAGLELALASLGALRFERDQLDWLRGLEVFAHVPASFFDELAAFRFRGDVRAMAEGTLFFPGEPVLSVSGSLLEAQIVETLLLSIVNFQVAIASKAARLRLAAGPRATLAEFGGRRAHGPQAATWAARAAYVGGCDATSNVLAGQRLGIPVVGTMAHSYVMSFEREIDAFRHYQSVYPEHTIHLVDTYDTLEGVRRALATGRPFRGVRIDSGDLAALARAARGLLDEGGRPDALIFASGDLDEHRIARLVADGAPIDSFGVGTELATSYDAPALSGVYKLVETVAGGQRELTYKASAGKEMFPGAKQVVRAAGAGGLFTGDRVVPAGAGEPAGEGLLRPVMRAGRILGRDDLAAARARCLDQLARLPAPLRALAVADRPYPVSFDPAFGELLERAKERTGAAPRHATAR
jgi:nicotinate phosphoribosyltransferase